MSEHDPDPLQAAPARGREPVFNAPWPPIALVLAVVGAFLLQDRAGNWGFAFALYPYRVTAGDPAGLVSSLFLHGGWAHVFMNSAFCIAFGAPVARLLGPDLKGVLSFFVFYAVCGVLAGLTFVAFHMNGQDPVVGASGAVAGLMGAGARLMDRPGVLSPVFGRSAFSMGVAWLAINLLLAFTPVAELLGGGQVAWEAHLGGFAAGLLLIGPFHRILRR
jgi:membrane associated rhomboid family serine protease